MRKNVLLAAALATSMLAFAQEEQERPVKSSNEVRSKRGHIILPQEGDLAIGFNTVPVIDFLFSSLDFVSLFGGTAGSASNLAGNAIDFVENANRQIVGKYYLADDAAIRVRFGHNTLRGSRTNQVQDAVVMAAAILGTQDDIDAASLIKVDDELHYQKRNVVLVAGYEKRRGYGRLQGFYGAEGGINWTKADYNIEYGNAFSDQHEVQFTNFFGNNLNNNSISTLNPTSTSDASRILDAEERGGFGFGVRGFIGAEYFFAPKISIAVEYGWGYAYTNASGSKYTQETYHNGQNGPEVLIEEINNDESSSSHSFSVDNNGSNSSPLGTSLSSTSLSGSSGSITLLLHF